jgi:hypothetical protein
MTSKRLERLLLAQRGRCFFCDKPLPATTATVEHLVAKANGGNDQDGNCVACCKSANQLLGSMSLKEKIQICLSHKGQFKCPNGTAHQVSAKKTQFMTECYEKLVANLNQRKTAKPGTVTKLKNTITSLFPKQLSADQVDKLIQQLRNRQVIFVTGSKITYP